MTYLPSDVKAGDYTGKVVVTATDAAGNISTTNGDVEFVTLVENYTITSATTGGQDNIVNADEAQGGISFGGTVEAGSTVMVSFAGMTREADVVNGSWSITFEQGSLPQSDGETFTMTAIATDLAKNVSTELTQDVVIDNWLARLR